jgi:hypothetical protein
MTAHHAVFRNALAAFLAVFRNALAAFLCVFRNALAAFLGDRSFALTIVRASSKQG